MIKQSSISNQKQLIKLKAEQFSRNDLDRIQNIEFKQIPVIGLTDTDQKYIYLVNAIKNYNQNNKSGAKTQLYEYQIYQKISQILKQLKYQTSQTKKIVIQKTLGWFNSEQQKINHWKQEKALYKQNKLSRNKLNLSTLNVQKSRLQLKGFNIGQLNISPSLRMKQQFLPFKNKNRSAYSQIKPATQRLKQYQRKQIIISNRSNKSQLPKNNQNKMANRVSYHQNPVYRVNQNQSLFNHQTINSSLKQGESILDTKQINTQITSTEFKNNNIDDIIKSQQPPKNQILNQIQNQVPNSTQNQVQFDGPVQQQQQEDDKEEQILVKDKLAPHTKPYRSAMKIEQEKSIKHFQSSYINNKNDLNIERMENKYIKSLNKKSSIIKQDQQLRENLETWAKHKARQQKQRKRRLESKITKFTSRIEKSLPLQQKNLSLQQEIKYNLTKITPVKKNDLNISFELPKIFPQNKYVNSLLQFQKSILKNRTIQNRKKLKRNISIDNQQSDTNSADFGYSIPTTLNQVYKQKRLSFAQILSQHSIQKQKQKQIQQVYQIKDRLAKHNFASIDINTIARGLVLPQVQQNQLAVLPQKQLFHNKFFVVPTKKKRKKKK